MNPEGLTAGKPPKGFAENKLLMFEKFIFISV